MVYLQLVLSGLASHERDYVSIAIFFHRIVTFG